MPHPCVLILFLSHLSLTTSINLDQPTGTVRVPEVDLCIAQIRQLGNTPPAGALDGIVGNAYDALQSIDTMPVLPVRYTRCKTTPDGRYLIPDNVDAIPVLASNMDIMATYFNNFTTWYKSTTKSIDKELNAGWTHNFTGSIFSGSIHGSYSKLHQETKQAFYGQKSSMLHTKLKHHAYTLVADITGGLHPGLQRRLMDVAASLEDDLLLRARYQMEMIVRDYGTHVAYKADVGAIVEKEDFIDSKSVTTETSQLDSLRKEASASFSYIFKLDAKVTSTSVVNETRREAYEESLTHVQIRNSGGPSVNRLMAGGNDSPFVDNLVGLDEEGLMLFSLINSYNLPHLERPAVDRLALLLLNATQRYYDENAVRGCTDSEAENFNFQANIEDGSCQPDFNNYTFGGMYQTCSNVNHPDNPLHASDHCAPYYQKNGVTGDFTCPDNYEPVLITSEVYALADETLEGPTKKHCKHFAWFKYHCKKEKTYYTIKVQVRLENYWCRLKQNATAPEGSGAMFGGFFRNGETNPFTGRAGCPGSYRPYKLALDTTVCLSRDYQLDHEYKVDFAGFFSCQSSQAEKKCDLGYSQHWVTSAEGCDVYYCVRPTVFAELIPRPIRLPPYTPYWAMMSNSSVSTVTGFINGTKWLDMPLDEAFKFAQVYVNKLPDKVGFSMDLGSSRAILEKWIEDNWKEVALVLEKDPDNFASRGHRTEL